MEDYYGIKKEEAMDVNENNQAIYENVKQEEIKHDVKEEEMAEEKYLKRKIIDNAFLLDIIKQPKLKLEDHEVMQHLEVANRNFNNIDIDHVISENIKMEEKQSEFDNFVLKQGPTNPLYKEEEEEEEEAGPTARKIIDLKMEE